MVSIGARRQGGNALFDGTLSSFLNGALDDVRIYDVALTQSEIQSLVPEPSTLSLIALSTLILLTRRRQL